MSYDPTKLRGLQAIVASFIVAITVLIGVFSIGIGPCEFNPDSQIFIFIVMGIMIMSYLVGIIVGKVMMRNLIKQSLEAGELNFNTYQALTTFKIATFEAPAFVALIFYFFLVGGSPVQGLNPLLFVPVLIFYLSLISMFPTRAKLEKIQSVMSGNHDTNN